jgi:two-component system alkaline phosphatase synthesis response regulator PhoP
MAYKILIIEDLDDMVKPILQMLEYRGYEVITAQNGIDGVAQAIKHKPDLVIVDLLLVERGGEVSGFEAIKAIRGTPEIASIGILAWTSHFVRGQDEIQALRAGADDFVRKDVDFGVLEARIEALLRRRGHSPDLEVT